MQNKTVRMITRDAMFLALLIVCTFFTIQVPPATKFTLQLLAVFLIANFLPLVDGLIIVTLYIAMGLIGIPVFAGFSGGPAYVAAPTFGFVYGFYFVILINHLFNDLLLRRVKIDVVKTVIGSVISLIVLYIVGFIHGYLILKNLKGMTTLTFVAGLNIFIIPYIPFDIAKLVVACLITSRYMNLLVPYKRRHFDEINSTNTFLKENYAFYPNLTFVDASFQKEGKGRLGRKWDGTKGEALTFSILIKDKKLLSKAPLLSLLSGYVVMNYLESMGLKDVMIKWPNDVYVGGKKICGILLESVVKKDVKALVIGIGINVNQTSFEEDFRRTPTSMKLETNKDYEIKEIRKALYPLIKEELKKFVNGSSSYLEGINSHNFLLGQDCSCVYEGSEKKIVVKEIGEDGSLIGEIDGEEKHIFTDEISFNH
ncbi:MAG: biotin--[acetyl-CoA-carboxylase] ligase [Bacilli bacterium]|nr:biotin--[acetyl-CoA-carboxylase] ligase [Bacilli bacterium]